MNCSLPFYFSRFSFTILIAVIFITGGEFSTTALLSNRIIFQSAFGLATQEIDLNLKDILVNRTSQNITTVKIIFAAHNPQTYTVLLDGIHYKIFVGNQTVTSGDIGGESLIDVMRDEPEFPIISNDTVILKNAQTIHTSELKNDISNTINSGKTCFLVNGTYFYRQAANLTASRAGNDFKLKFPSGCR
jgi:hypothetical protein